MPDNHALDAVYRRTSFLADTPDGSCRIRVGEPAPCVDTLLARHGATAWAYITAWNPASVVATPEQNERQNAALARELTARGVALYTGFGVPDEPTWTPEASFLAIGLDEAEAVALARQFEQAAIVVGTTGTLPRLVWCFV